MTEDVLLAAPCGLWCGDCEFLGEKCRGCGHIEGKPFWVEHYGMENCAMYACAVRRSGLEHCGQCVDFPCKQFLSMYDSSLSEEKAAQAMAQRKKDLLRRKEIGTAAWLAERETEGTNNEQ